VAQGMDKSESLLCLCINVSVHVWVWSPGGSVIWLFIGAGRGGQVLDAPNFLPGRSLSAPIRPNELQ